MRKDLKIFEIINEERNREKSTGCCIRKDGSGCVQTLSHNCSVSLKLTFILLKKIMWNEIKIIKINNFSKPFLWTLHKWNNNTNRGPSYSIDLRSSGPVCGQDPRYCEQPASTGSYEWPDDITKWPVS
jgi:hypothetical protein